MSYNTEGPKPLFPPKKPFWAHFLPQLYHKPLDNPVDSTTQPPLETIPAQHPSQDDQRATTMQANTKDIRDESKGDEPESESDLSNNDFTQKTITPFPPGTFDLDHPFMFPNPKKPPLDIEIPDDIQPLQIHIPHQTLSPYPDAPPPNSPLFPLYPDAPVSSEENPHETTFDKHQREYLAKHADEVLPTDTGPYAVAIVSRAYRELSNGNLTERLLSLVAQKIPTSEFKSYISVNNVRVDAIAAEVWEREKDMLEQLSSQEREAKLHDLIIGEFSNRGVSMSAADAASLALNGKAKLETRAKDYRENQATLQVLDALTTAVNAVYASGEKDQIVMTALDQIKKSATGFLSEGQLQLLLQASAAVIKRRIFVMGVDCSSFEKAFEGINHGKATNEACHIAISQGAKYIDVSDMDEYHGPTALQEILRLSKEGHVDVLIRPLTLITPLHPEQLSNSQKIWTSLVEYYANSHASYARSYGDISTNSSGCQIVSAKAFRKHEYPEVGYNEDFRFAHNMKEDSELVVRASLSSDLQLAHRGRDVSWDGSGMSESSEQFAENVRLNNEINQRSSIERFAAEHTRLHARLEQANNEHIEDLPNLLKLYEEKMREYFKGNQEKRVKLRRFFLGIKPDGKVDHNAVLPILYKELQAHPDLDASQLIEQTHLKPRYKAFLEQNPLILPGVLQEIKRIQNTTSASLTQSEIPAEHLPAVFGQPKSHLLSIVSITQHIVNSLPELFGEPLKEQPSYNPETIREMSPSEVNVMNWFHLFQAERWLKSYIFNLQAENDLSYRAKDELSYLPSISIY